LNKKIGELWFTDIRDYAANVYPPYVDGARFAYTDAFECGPLLPGEFHPLPKFFPQSDLGHRADSRWSLPQISSFILFRLWVFPGSAEADIWRGGN